MLHGLWLSGSKSCTAFVLLGLSRKKLFGIESLSDSRKRSFESLLHIDFSLNFDLQQSKALLGYSCEDASISKVLRKVQQQFFPPWQLHVGFSAKRMAHDLKPGSSPSTLEPLGLGNSCWGLWGVSYTLQNISQYACFLPARPQEHTSNLICDNRKCLQTFPNVPWGGGYRNLLWLRTIDLNERNGVLSLGEVHERGEEGEPSAQGTTRKLEKMRRGQQNLVRSWIQRSNNVCLEIRVVILESGVSIELDFGMFLNTIRGKINTKIVIIIIDIFKEITILNKSLTNSHQDFELSE